MRLTKRQVRIVDALQNGGHLWTAGDCVYLASKMANGHYLSEAIHRKTYDALRVLGIIHCVANRWVLR